MRPGPVRIALVAGGLLVAADASVADADPDPDPPDQIQWSAPTECPDRQELVRSIERQLGGPLESRGGQHLRVAIDVARDPNGKWRLHLATRTHAGSEGQRVIEGSSCEEVAEAAATIVALAIHAEAETGRLAPVTGPMPSAAQPDLPAVVRDDATAVGPTSAPPPLRWTARVAAGGAAGGQPSPGPGVGVAVSLNRGRARVELGAAYWLRRRATVSGQPSMGGELGLTAAMLRGCYAVIGDAISSCAGVELGSLQAAGVGDGVAQPVMKRSAWVAPFVGLSASWPMTHRIDFVAQADVAFPVTRPHFVLYGAGGAVQEVYQPSAVVGRAWLGIEVRFP